MVPDMTSLNWLLARDFLQRFQVTLKVVVFLGKPRFLGELAKVTKQ